MANFADSDSLYCDCGGGGGPDCDCFTPNCDCGKKNPCDHKNKDMPSLIAILDMLKKQIPSLKSRVDDTTVLLSENPSQFIIQIKHLQAQSDARIMSREIASVAFHLTLLQCGIPQFH